MKIWTHLRKSRRTEIIGGFHLCLSKESSICLRVFWGWSESSSSAPFTVRTRTTSLWKIFPPTAYRTPFIRSASPRSRSNASTAASRAAVRVLMKFCASREPERGTFYMKTRTWRRELLGNMENRAFSMNKKREIFLAGEFMFKFIFFTFSFFWSIMHEGF